MINQQKSPTINDKSLKIINNLSKSLQNNQESHNIQWSNNDPESNLKNEVFRTIIENKNLIKQGLYLLEICQNAVGSTDLATDRRGHDGPSWTP